jgi:hypothetical protein
MMTLPLDKTFQTYLQYKVVFYSCMYYRIHHKSKDIDFNVINKEIDHIVTKTLEYRL